MRSLFGRWRSRNRSAARLSFPGTRTRWGTLFGGRLMHFIDLVGAMAA